MSDDDQPTLRQRVFSILDDDDATPSTTQLVVDWALIALILVSVAIVILATMPEFALRFGAPLWYVEAFCVAVFTVEYGLRLWVSVEHRSGDYRHPVWGRLRYAVTPLALIDLMAILPFYLALVLPFDSRLLRLIRLVRILKITRYAPALATLQSVLITERRSIAASFFLIMVGLTFSASLMYAIERDVQPEAFGSIPQAMWWSVITMTTVGFGDVTPITPLGKLLGGVTALFGIAMIALPASVLGTGFAKELRKQDLVISLALCARVPLLAHMPPARLTELAAAMHTRLVPPGKVIFRKGDPADSMVFIGEGSAEVQVRPRPVRLGPGDFFGELGLLRNARRSATVVALTPCRLLVLDAYDFHRLIGDDTELMNEIRATAERRRAAGVA